MREAEALFAMTASMFDGPIYRVPHQPDAKPKSPTARNQAPIISAADQERIAAAEAKRARKAARRLAQLAAPPPRHQKGSA
jgi:hypothetical protein